MADLDSSNSLWSLLSVLVLWRGFTMTISTAIIIISIHVDMFRHSSWNDDELVTIISCNRANGLSNSVGKVDKWSYHRNQYDPSVFVNHRGPSYFRQTRTRPSQFPNRFQSLFPKYFSCSNWSKDHAMATVLYNDDAWIEWLSGKKRKQTIDYVPCRQGKPNPNLIFRDYMMVFCTEECNVRHNMSDIKRSYYLVPESNPEADHNSIYGLWAKSERMETSSQKY